MRSLKFIVFIIFYQFILLSCSFPSETNDNSERCAKTDRVISSLEELISKVSAKLANSESECDLTIKDNYNEIINLYKDEIDEYQKKVKFCQINEASRPQQNQYYQWVDLNGSRSLPSNAVLGGQNVDKLPLHVARGKGNESDIYAKLYQFTFYPTDAYKEFMTSSYEVSVAHKK